MINNYLVGTQPIVMCRHLGNALISYVVNLDVAHILVVVVGILAVVRHQVVIGDQIMFTTKNPCLSMAYKRKISFYCMKPIDWCECEGIYS